VSNVYVSAYTGDDKVVIVVVNTGNSAVDQGFYIQNSKGTSEVPSWQTTPNSNMSAGQVYQASKGAFKASLPGQSISTFVLTVNP
jgi:glucuronoarabinoxylan endo-1,4-beta-xylanase